MFTDSFLETLGESAAVIVSFGFLIGLIVAGFYIFRAGVNSRVRLEKRGGLFESVEEYKKKEDAELEAIKKRRSELGRTD